MSIAVREFTLADHAMVDELREAVGADLEQVSTDALAPNASGAKAFLADSGSFMFGAYVDHEVAGGIWGSAIRHPNGTVTVEARELYVLAQVRRRGIGTLLVESALAMARRGGAASFEVRSTAYSGIIEVGALLGARSGPGVECWVL